MQVCGRRISFHSALPYNALTAGFLHVARSSSALILLLQHNPRRLSILHDSKDSVVYLCVCVALWSCSCGRCRLAPVWTSWEEVMRHFSRLVASIFGPISCSSSWGQYMAGMAVEPLTQLVIDWDQSDVTACCEFTFNQLCTRNISFNKYPSRYLEFCISPGR